ncbi:hypothetical protein Tco_0956004 [Tanacetum coccineum]|uniref:Uncharacterized protein n=1 Tax=Tanacetum coccineum TaxID=301880 RepID=A0ABQ5E8V4_9ASTR
MPSPSVSTFTFPSTTEPVFSASTSEPVFESPNHTQTSQTTQSQQLQQYHTTTVSNNNAKFPYLKKEEYETWAMKMEYWIMNSDHNLWNIVLNGNSRKRTGRDPKGNFFTAKHHMIFYMKNFSTYRSSMYLVHSAIRQMIVRTWLTAMASEHSSSGPALHEMTPTTISSGLVPNPPS